MGYENQASSVRNKSRRMPLALSFQVESNSQHFETISHFLRDDFHGLRELCDVQLRFNTELVPVHSVILAAYSSLGGKFKVVNKCYEVDLSFLNRNSVVRILEYLYSGQMTLCFDTLHNDLDVISYLGIEKLQVLVEKKLVEIATEKRCVDVLNMATANLKTIPHSLSTLLSVSDETVRDLVNILHDSYVSNQLPYEQILKLSTNTIVTMLSARVADTKKVEIINMALKWIYERRLSDDKASSILRVLTFGSLTYAQLVAFRNSLIQTAVPVTIGRCIRLKHQDNDLLDLVFLQTENSRMNSFRETPTNTAKSTSYTTDPTLPFSSPTITTSSYTPSSHTVFEKSAPSDSSHNIDDCSTAMSFDADDVKRLGFEKPPGK